MTTAAGTMKQKREGKCVLPRKGAKRSARRTPAPAHEDTTVMGMGSERRDTPYEKNRTNRDRCKHGGYLLIEGVSRK
jgi:hypothetical protein